MKNALKLLCLILAVAMLGTVLTACSGQVESTPAAAEEPAAEEPAAEEPAAEEPAAEEPAGPVELVVGTTQANGSFDTTSMSMNTGYLLVYDTILARQADGTIVGNIASDFEFEDDLTLKLTIRDDVYFSNGDLCTPEDVLFSMERFITTNSAYVASTFYNNVIWEDCTIDGNVLTVKFQNPCPVFPATLATPKWAAVLDKSYVESTGEEEFWSSPVGTGPYTCTEYVADSYMTFERRDDYWGEMPDVEKYTVKYYAEETTMFIDYENGVLDMCLGISDTNLQRVQSGEVAGNCVIAPQHDFVIICLPEYVEAFNDIEVRKAIAYAVDYEALTETAFGALAKTATSTLMSTSDCHVDVGTYEYNPELAKQILADAGYEEGDLSFRMVIVNFPSNEKIAETLQAYLADVGIELQVESYDLGTAMSYFMNSDLDISIGEGSIPCVDPAQIYAMAEPTHTNTCMIQTGDEVVDLLYGAKYEMDPAAREEAYAKVQQWFYDNYRWLPICEKLAATCYNEKIAEWDCFWNCSTYPDLKTVKVN